MTLEVQSSNLKNVAYNATDKSLEVEFRNGRKYRYTNVPPEIFDGLVNADSIGGFFHKHIRFSFKYEEIGERN
jgi:hypothetical protein